MIKDYYDGIPHDGLIRNMPNDVYHATSGFISSSGLSLIARSPAHYKYAEPRQKTRALTLGSATHTAILEPEKFKDMYMVLNGVTTRTAAAYKQAIKHRDEELTLTQTEGDQITMMQQQVHSHPLAGKIIEQAAEFELSVFTKDPGTGVNVRIRPDIVGGGEFGGYLFDLKTTRDARDEPFSRSIYDYRYHVQAAFYMDMYEHATGEKLNGFKIVCVESAMPHSVVVYELDDISLSIGRKQYKKDLSLYAECLEKDVWSHYEGTDNDVLISLPEWVLRNELGE